MAGPSYPHGLKGRPGSRPLSGGPATVQGNPRNTGRGSLSIDLRDGGNLTRSRGVPLGHDTRTGRTIVGDILGPNGRPLDSSRAATVRGVMRSIEIEGELGRGAGPKAKRLRAILEKMLGKGNPLLKKMGLLGIAGVVGDLLTSGLSNIYDDLKAGPKRVPVNASLCWEVAPSVLPSPHTWIGTVDTGTTTWGCPTYLTTTVRRLPWIEYPHHADGYPVGSYLTPPRQIASNPARYSGLYTWRYSNSSTWQYFQIAAAYSAIDSLKPAYFARLVVPTSEFGNVLEDKVEEGQPSRRARHFRPPRTKPYQLPAITTEVVVGPKTPPNAPVKPSKVDVHDRVPPGPGVKERKRRVGMAVLALVNGVTEGCDIVDAAYKALPWQFTRWKGRDGKWRNQDITCHMRALRVFRHALDMDMSKFFENLKENQLEDTVFGTLGKAKGATGRSLGLSRIPNIPKPELNVGVHTENGTTLTSLW